mgnify:FL=1
MIELVLHIIIITITIIIIIIIIIIIMVIVITKLISVLSMTQFRVPPCPNLLPPFHLVIMGQYDIVFPQLAWAWSFE